MMGSLPVAHDTGSSESDDCMDEAPPWIDWFLSLRENAFFVEVDEEFIVDRFNLTGLMSLGPHLQPAIDRIIMTEEQFFEETDAARNDVPAVIMAENDSQHEPSAEAKARREIQAAAIQLYGLIHARYLMTPRGLTKMYEKFCSGVFGTCPRVYCRSFSLLPIGLSDIPGQASVQLYCAHCEDVYRPRATRYSSIDGAYFGTSFPHLFLQQFKQCVPKKFTDRYTPKIFGFKLHSNRLLEESASCKAKPDVMHVGPPSRDNALPADP